MRKGLFGSIESLDGILKASLGYDTLLVDRRNSIFVLLAFLMVVTVVPSAVGLVCLVCFEAEFFGSPLL